MEITLLHPEQIRSFTKVFSKNSKDNNTRFNNKRFTSTVQSFEDIASLLTLLLAQATAGNALLVGHLTKAITNETRAQLADVTAKTHIGILDADNIDLSPEELIDRIPFLQNVSYILHWSASQGVTRADGTLVKAGYNYHLIFVFSKPLAPMRWGNIIKHINYEFLKDDITLNNMGIHLKLPLDFNLGNPAQLLTIAPPIIDEIDFHDTLDNRWELVEKDHSQLIVENLPQVTTDKLRKAQKSLINDMREDLGMEPVTKQTVKYSPKSDTMVAAHPCQAKLHFLNEDNGFCHYNLENGDSGSYWHPSNRPEVIQSFKPDEPKYKHEQLDPESYKNACQRANIAIATSTKTEYKIILSADADKFYGVKFNNVDRTVSCLDMKKGHIMEHCSAEDLEMPTTFEHYSLRFNPADKRIFIPEEQIINIFEEPRATLAFSPADEPQYTRDTISAAMQEQTPHIYDVLYSSNGNCHEATIFELNWLASLVVDRRKPTVSIVKSGTQGTGKNYIIKHIYKPLLGEKYVVEMSRKTINANFNAGLDTTRLFHMDETNIEAKEVDYLNTLKGLQTANTQQINKKFCNPYMADLHFGMMFFSNGSGFMPIELGDRRTWVSPQQGNKLTHIFGIDITEDRGEKIDTIIADEIPKFVAILYDYKVDYAYMTSQEVLNTPAKQRLQTESKSYIDEFVDAVIHGDLDYFIGNINIISSDAMGGQEITSNSSIIHMVQKYLPYLQQEITMDFQEIALMYAIIHPNQRNNAKKTQSMMNKHGLKIEGQLPCDADEGRVAASTIRVTWRATEDLLYKIKGGANVSREIPTHLKTDKTPVKH